MMITHMLHEERLLRNGFDWIGLNRNFEKGNEIVLLHEQNCVLKMDEMDDSFHRSMHQTKIKT